MSASQRPLLRPFDGEDQSGGEEMCTPQGCALPVVGTVSNPSEPRLTESAAREEA